ncbi:hypothetical protein AAHA92_15677 [Salvia divinorum]|uniref:Reverse transcriptase domain-containing protein n=1 Tax=Salvia divinorum TaxID=28513 RepID=A0ABD1HG48_SALDI
MFSSTTNTGWTETLPMGSLPVSLDPVISQITQTPPLDPIATSIEHILATLARVENRLNDQDRRITATAAPFRPNPDPPYFPSFHSATAVAVPTPTLPFASGFPASSAPSTQPWRQPLVPANYTDFVPRPPPGFRSSGPRAHGPRPYLPPPTSAWDNPSARVVPEAHHGHNGPSSWDHPSARQPYGVNNHDPSKQFKMDPPHFDGSNEPSWISRIEFYFDHIMLPEDHRLHFVIMLFDPPVTDWIFNYRANNPSARWRDFLEDVRRKFDPKYFTNYIELLAKLMQTGTVAGYNTEFDNLMNNIHGVPESTLLPIYIGGLHQSVKNQVKFQHPVSVAAAMALATEFDSAVERPAHQPFQRCAWQPREARQQPPTGGVTPMSGPGPQTARPRGPEMSKLPIIRLSAAEKAERSKKGICWYCPDHWAPGHACRSNFLVYMGEEEDEAEQQDEEQHPPEPDVVTADLSHIYALEGRQRSDSIELQGSISKRPVTILVDTGSSHDFLHPDVAEKLHLPLTAINPFRVYVGNGESLLCSFASLQTTLIIQDHVFQIDLHILPVHGPDIILGMAWLRSLHRVTNDYDSGTIEFLRDGCRVCLRISPSLPRQVSSHSFAAIMSHQGVAEMFELVHCPVTLAEPDSAMSFPPELPTAVLSALEAHSSVFQVPSGMPPARTFDHRIHLLPNSKPANVRPYRYPYFQKNEIERQVREMLDSGIIRPSQSPFSSPVLLIRKKDDTFRFCIDYRALNTATVPDHFPIPTTDELFDELGAARFFTKLDLRSGYHQIRMNTNDIYKTAFRTHDGHFEFLVMPFGLTNAPSTFQAAMNDIFRPLLRKFVIVFFDDILIYSPTVDEHGHHIRQVLSILSDHQFFVKLSKCTFCCSTVDNLGHLSSGGELKADPTKIAAMVAWPTPTSVKQLRGFLGLTGYYRRFISGYAMIAAPLTELLRKDAFIWSDAAEDSFTALKQAMTTAHVLHLPDFDKTFYLETDASDFGIGAVLLQDNHPLAFFSKKLGPRRRVTSTYHKELYAIVEAVQKWRQYLLGREFIIRSDQKSLKELLQ